MDALGLIRTQVEQCEAEGVSLLCCPEAVLGAAVFHRGAVVGVAAQGAAAVFVPTNNELPSSKGGAELVGLARDADIARAVENRLWVIRADVAGRSAASMSYGSTGVVNPRVTLHHERRDRQTTTVESAHNR
jgi:hypothetical protein